jgi:hypothetical protein
MVTTGSSLLGTTNSGLQPNTSYSLGSLAVVMIDSSDNAA